MIYYSLSFSLTFSIVVTTHTKLSALLLGHLKNTAKTTTTLKRTMATKHDNAAATTRSTIDLYPHGIKPLPQGVPADEILKRLGGPEHIQVAPLSSPSLFVKPQSVFFQLDGKKRRWDMVSSHASIAILLYHTTLQAFILVRQFRPAVYATAVRTAAEEKEQAATGSSSTPNSSSSMFPSSLPLHHGFTFELCAGIVGDKPELSLYQVAQEEILEETGFEIDIKNLKKITSFNSAVGISGSRQTIFAAEVDDSMLAVPKDGVGGGLADHGEAIEVVALPAAAVENFLFDESLGKSAGLMFALTYASSSGMFK
jgi:UDP-sugar diphosphatase